MNQRELIRRLFIASVVMALVLAGYALSFVTVFKIQEASSSDVSAFIVSAVGVRVFLMGLLNIAIFFYCNRYFSSLSDRDKKLIRHGIGVVLNITLYLVTDPFVHSISSRRHDEWIFSQQFPAVLVQTAISYLMVASVHEITILHYEKSRALIENADLKAARVESAYLLLRQQTHPHFLFNALSTLKTLYKKDTPAGEAYLTHLVNFLRASLTDSQSKLSTVGEEIRLCDDYIAMQQIRFDEALRYEVRIPEAVLKEGAIPAFSLQSLIENAIKHNEVTDHAPLLVRIYYRDGWLVTENKIQPKSYLDAPSKKGLSNLIERYRLISDEKVIISQENGIFSVSIKVLPYENRHH